MWVIHKTTCILFFFCLKTISIMVIFLNSHAWVEVPRTSLIFIHVTHAHLIKKIQFMFMPKGLQFVKNFYSLGPQGSHVNFLRYLVCWVCPKVDTQPTLVSNHNHIVAYTQNLGYVYYSNNVKLSFSLYICQGWSAFQKGPKNYFWLANDNDW